MRENLASTLTGTTWFLLALTFHSGTCMVAIAHMQLKMTFRRSISMYVYQKNEGLRVGILVVEAMNPNHTLWLTPESSENRHTEIRLLDKIRASCSDCHVDLSILWIAILPHAPELAWLYSMVLVMFYGVSNETRDCQNKLKIQRPWAGRWSSSDFQRDEKSKSGQHQREVYLPTVTLCVRKLKFNARFWIDWNSGSGQSQSTEALRALISGICDCFHRAVSRPRA